MPSFDSARSDVDDAGGLVAPDELEEGARHEEGALDFDLLQEMRTSKSLR